MKITNKLKSLVSAALVAVSTMASADGIEGLKMYGAIRTFMDYDEINTPEEQPSSRVSNFITKIGVELKEPISNDGWTVAGKYETSWQSDDPRNSATFIGNQQSTIGFQNHYIDKYSTLKVDFGRRSHALWTSFKKYGIYNDLYGSPMGEIHERYGLWWSNGIFVTAKPTSDLTLTYDHRLSEQAGVRGAQVYGAEYRFTDWLTAGILHLTDHELNKSTLITTQVKIPETKWTVNGMFSDNRTNGVDTNGQTYAFIYQATPKLKILPGFGNRNDGVKAYTMGFDYQLSERVTLQAHGQRVIADDPIVFTTANDITGLRGGSFANAATGTSRTQFGVGLQFTF